MEIKESTMINFRFNSATSKWWTHRPILIFLFLAVLLRWFAFFPLEINHDESTYIVIADSLLKGKIYLREIIDTKPIGIFWIYAILLWISGKSLFFIKFFAAIAVGITAWFIYAISERISNDRRISIAAGIFYIILCSCFSRWGLGPNTELYFNLFNLAALRLSLFDGKWVNKLIAGILFGIAFQIKYVALAEALALGFFLVVNSIQHRTFILACYRQVLPLMLGFVLPGLVVLFYFYHFEQWDAYLFLNWKVSANYSSEMDMVVRLKFFGDYFFRFLFFSFPAVLFLFSRELKNSRYIFFFVPWLLLDLLIIAAPGKYFEHYFVQLMPWTALMCALSFTIKKVHAFWKKWLLNYAMPLLLVLVLGLSYGHYNWFIIREDKVKQISNELKDILLPEEGLYTGNSFQLLYFTLNLESPTPYIHSSLLWNKEHRRALGIDLQKEVEQILLKKPKYMLLSHPIEDPILESIFLQHYEFGQELSYKINLYKRKDPK